MCVCVCGGGGGYINATKSYAALWYKSIGVQRLLHWRRRRMFLLPFFWDRHQLLLILVAGYLKGETTPIQQLKTGS